MKVTMLGDQLGVHLYLCNNYSSHAGILIG
jgi:hypothetical protein